MRNYLMPVNKKQLDEHLQDIRNKHKDGIRYRRRVQEDEEAKRYLAEELHEELKKYKKDYN